MLLPLSNDSTLTTLQAQIDDDIFSGGHTSMLIGAEDGLNAVVFDCSKNRLEVTFAEQSSLKNTEEDAPVELVFKVAQRNSMTLDAHTIIRNSHYLGVISDDSDAIKILLSQLISSKYHLLVGVRSPQTDSRTSFIFNIVNSTSTMNNFIKACGITLPAS